MFGKRFEAPLQRDTLYEHLEIPRDTLRKNRHGPPSHEGRRARTEKTEVFAFQKPVCFPQRDLLRLKILRPTQTQNTIHSNPLKLPLYSFMGYRRFVNLRPLLPLAFLSLVAAAFAQTANAPQPAGLVTTRRMGRETFCRLLPEAFASFAERQSVVLGLLGAAERDRAAS